MPVLNILQYGFMEIINEREEGLDLFIDYSKIKQIGAIDEEVIPVVVQDALTKDVLIVAYANHKALEYTLENKIAAFWSTSRNEMWVKGATSGDILDIVDIRINCEQNSLLYLVKLRKTGSCHTCDSNGNTRYSCYYRRVKKDGLEFIER
jgi:phosphoribosyl-AMP cyclohydrolase